MDRTTKPAGNSLPMGYSLEDKEILILDDAGNRLACDRAGEIAIRSRYLALGYWRKPRLTQKAFLPDPDGGEKRIYLTGDIKPDRAV